MAETKGLNVVVIGGGSSYTPELIDIPEGEHKLRRFPCCLISPRIMEELRAD
nr:hypothetical protein [Paenibacillus tyrfis]